MNKSINNAIFEDIQLNADISIELIDGYVSVDWNEYFSLGLMAAPAKVISKQPVMLNLVLAASKKNIKFLITKLYHCNNHCIPMCKNVVVK